MASKKAPPIAFVLITLFILIGSSQMAQAQWCYFYAEYGTCVSGQVMHSQDSEQYAYYTNYGLTSVAGSAALAGASSAANASLSSNSLWISSYGDTPFNGNVSVADTSEIAAFWDRLTFSGAVPGATGTFLFHGVAESQGATGGVVDVWTQFSQAQVVIPQNMDLMPFTLSLVFPLDSGQSVDLYVWMSGWADAGWCCTTYSGISIDPEWELILPDGVTMTSASGVVYPADSPVPEPSTLLMLGTGVLGLAGVIRRTTNL